MIPADQLAVTAIAVMLGCQAFAGMVAALVVDVVTSTRLERQRHQLNHEADQLWSGDYWVRDTEHNAQAGWPDP